MSPSIALAFALGLLVAASASAAPSKKPEAKPKRALNVDTKGGTLDVTLRAKRFFNHKTWNILNATRHPNEIVVDIRVISGRGRVVAEKVMAYEISQSKSGYEVKVNQGPAKVIENREKLRSMMANFSSVVETKALKGVKRAYVELRMFLNPVQIVRVKRRPKKLAPSPIRSVSYDVKVTYRSRQFEL
ncbi:MAG: hypothetical protein KC609_22150 [Myxococcales bacterium]|nr:hypothetical protein [Myxococcales bacterium]